MSNLSNVLGANFDRVTAGTTTDGEGAEMKLGTTITASDGITYRYVQAGAAVSTTVYQPLALAIDSAEQAILLTAAGAKAGKRLGFAPAQIIADNAFFWARLSGVFTIRVGASCSADAVLSIAAAGAGRLISGSLTGSGAEILGVVITAAGSGSASAGNTLRTAIVGPLSCLDLTGG